MATRSRLRAVFPNGEALKPIYCHWDGGTILPILNEHYNTEEKVKELMALGNLSALRERVKPNEGEKHSFDNPVSNVTIAYHRDRGDDLEFWGDRQECNYLFDGLTWKVDKSSK